MTEFHRVINCARNRSQTLAFLGREEQFQREAIKLREEKDAFELHQHFRDGLLVQTQLASNLLLGNQPSYWRDPVASYLPLFFLAAARNPVQIQPFPQVLPEHFLLPMACHFRTTHPLWPKMEVAYIQQQQRLGHSRPFPHANPNGEIIEHFVRIACEVAMASRVRMLMSDEKNRDEVGFTKEEAEQWIQSITYLAGCYDRVREATIEKLRDGKLPGLRYVMEGSIDERMAKVADEPLAAFLLVELGAEVFDPKILEHLVERLMDWFHYDSVDDATLPGVTLGKEAVSCAVTVRIWAERTPTRKIPIVNRWVLTANYDDVPYYTHDRSPPGQGMLADEVERTIVEDSQGYDDSGISASGSDSDDLSDSNFMSIVHSYFPPDPTLALLRVTHQMEKRSQRKARKSQVFRARAEVAKKETAGECSAIDHSLVRGYNTVSDAMSHFRRSDPPPLPAKTLSRFWHHLFSISDVKLRRAAWQQVPRCQYEHIRRLHARMRGDMPTAPSQMDDNSPYVLLASAEVDSIQQHTQWRDTRHGLAALANKYQRELGRQIIITQEARAVQLLNPEDYVAAHNYELGDPLHPLLATNTGLMAVVPSPSEVLWCEVQRAADKVIYDLAHVTPQDFLAAVVHDDADIGPIISCLGALTGIPTRCITVVRESSFDLRLKLRHPLTLQTVPVRATQYLLVFYDGGQPDPETLGEFKRRMLLAGKHTSVAEFGLIALRTGIAARQDPFCTQPDMSAAHLYPQLLHSLTWFLWNERFDHHWDPTDLSRWLEEIFTHLPRGAATFKSASPLYVPPSRLLERNMPQYTKSNQASMSEIHRLATHSRFAPGSDSLQKLLDEALRAFMQPLFRQTQSTSPILRPEDPMPFELERGKPRPTPQRHRITPQSLFPLPPVLPLTAPLPCQFSGTVIGDSWRVALEERLTQVGAAPALRNQPIPLDPLTVMRSLVNPQRRPAPPPPSTLPQTALPFWDLIYGAQDSLSDSHFSESELSAEDDFDDQLLVSAGALSKNRAGIQLQPPPNRLNCDFFSPINGPIPPYYRKEITILAKMANDFVHPLNILKEALEMCGQPTMPVTFRLEQLSAPPDLQYRPHFQLPSWSILYDCWSTVGFPPLAGLMQHGGGSDPKATQYFHIGGSDVELEVPVLACAIGRLTRWIFDQCPSDPYIRSVLHLPLLLGQAENKFERHLLNVVSNAFDHDTYRRIRSEAAPVLTSGKDFQQNYPQPLQEAHVVGLFGGRVRPSGDPGSPTTVEIPNYQRDFLCKLLQEARKQEIDITVPTKNSLVLGVPAHVLDTDPYFDRLVSVFDGALFQTPEMTHLFVPQLVSTSTLFRMLFLLHIKAPWDWDTREVVTWLASLKLPYLEELSEVVKKNRVKGANLTTFPWLTYVPLKKLCDSSGQTSIPAMSSSLLHDGHLFLPPMADSWPTIREMCVSCVKDTTSLVMPPRIAHFKKLVLRNAEPSLAQVKDWTFQLQESTPLKWEGSCVTLAQFKRYSGAYRATLELLGASTEVKDDCVTITVPPVKMRWLQSLLKHALDGTANKVHVTPEDGIFGASVAQALVDPFYFLTLGRIDGNLVLDSNDSAPPTPLLVCPVTQPFKTRHTADYIALFIVSERLVRQYFRLASERGMQLTSYKAAFFGSAPESSRSGPRAFHLSERTWADVDAEYKASMRSIAHALCFCQIPIAEPESSLRDTCFPPKQRECFSHWQELLRHVVELVPRLDALYEAAIQAPEGISVVLQKMPPRTVEVVEGNVQTEEPKAVVAPQRVKPRQKRGPRRR
eukprot:TRINITY_DN5616_c0_g1_i1.p1 TRINITY_DN5616_c0_g1~~TRINITY_DN5616_c0_g1_i1.p1  ORF type:complete len:1939 (-),score=250.70 TRINITY_DN5616_c0_g1_i1:13-5349(-)